APAGQNFATTMVQPLAVIRPPPKFTVPLAVPMMTTLPPLSTATPFPTSLTPPPKALDQTGAPPAEYFARKMLLAPALVSAPVPKSIVPLNFPVTNRLPLPSTATARPVPPPTTPPRHFDHSVAPVGEYFDTNTAAGGHTTPPPKSTLLSTRPVITVLPLASTATP